jgi:flagellar basal-body rod protein FlgB
VPVDVDFESQLQQVQSALRESAPVDASMFATAQPRLVAATGADGLPVKVQLDEQVAASSLNLMHYQTLTRGLSRYFSMLSVAISDGKR